MTVPPQMMTDPILLARERLDTDDELFQNKKASILSSRREGAFCLHDDRLPNERSFAIIIIRTSVRNQGYILSINGRIAFYSNVMIVEGLGTDLFEVIRQRKLEGIASALVAHTWGAGIRAESS